MHSDVCVLCGKPCKGTFYELEDKVTLEKKHFCAICEAYPRCYVCGLPAETNATGFVHLPDDRVICSRDSQTAVLSNADGQRIAHEVRDGLDRLFSRFTSFPETNLTIVLADRINLWDLFKLAGNDYQCPDVFGYAQTSTNHGQLEHRISVMSGLPLRWFQTTCAHEFTHAWAKEKIPPQRQEALGKDTAEGFCELVAFLYAESQNAPDETARLLRNLYTRGQINLFVDAQRRFGFNDVVDWMLYGTDSELSANDPGRIRVVQMPPRAAPPATNLVFYLPPAAPAPDTLILKAVVWDPKRPLALVNNRTVAVNEEAKVRVGTSNVLVRCLSIRPEAVRLRLLDSGREQELRLCTDKRN